MLKINWLTRFSYTDLLMLPNAAKIAAFDRIAKSFTTSPNIADIEREIGEILASYVEEGKL